MPKSMNKNLYIVIMLYIITIQCIASNAVDKDNTRSNIDTLLLQMNTVINSRQQQQIKAFLNYYIQNDAIFIKHSTLIDPDTGQPKKSQPAIQMNKQEYIKYINGLVEAPYKYAFIAKANTVQENADTGIALVEVSIYETAIFTVKNNIQEKPAYVKTMVSTNCNYYFNTLLAPPLIGGANCTETIVIK